MYCYFILDPLFLGQSSNPFHSPSFSSRNDLTSSLKIDFFNSTLENPNSLPLSTSTTSSAFKSKPTANNYRSLSKLTMLANIDTNNTLLGGSITPLPSSSLTPSTPLINSAQYNWSNVQLSNNNNSNSNSVFNSNSTTIASGVQENNQQQPLLQFQQQQQSSQNGFKQPTVTWSQLNNSISTYGSSGYMFIPPTQYDSVSQIPSCYQSINCVEGFFDRSVEEIRFEDYKQNGLLTNNIEPLQITSTFPNQIINQSNTFQANNQPFHQFPQQTQSISYNQTPASNPFLYQTPNLNGYSLPSQWHSYQYHIYTVLVFQNFLNFLRDHTLESIIIGGTLLPLNSIPPLIAKPDEDPFGIHLLSPIARPSSKSLESISPIPSSPLRQFFNVHSISTPSTPKRTLSDPTTPNLSPFLTRKITNHVGIVSPHLSPLPNNNKSNLLPPPMSPIMLPKSFTTTNNTNNTTNSNTLSPPSSPSSYLLRNKPRLRPRCSGSLPFPTNLTASPMKLAEELGIELHSKRNREIIDGESNWIKTEYY